MSITPDYTLIIVVAVVVVATVVVTITIIYKVQILKKPSALYKEHDGRRGSGLIHMYKIQTK